MLDGYRIKHLFLKMGYDKLEETCIREGWKIPFASEIENESLDYEMVWTRDVDTTELLQEEVDCGVRLGICWDSEAKQRRTINKNFKMHCVVLVQKPKD